MSDETLDQKMQDEMWNAKG